MTRDIVMATEHTRDHLIVDGAFQSEGWISVGLIQDGDYYLKIEFEDLPEELYWKAVRLAKLNREITIKSDFLSRGKYDVTKFLGIWCSDAKLGKHITWHCARHSFSVEHWIISGADILDCGIAKSIWLDLQ